MSVCLSVCLSVYLSTHISQKPHVLISQNFLYILPVAMARSSFDGSAICHVVAENSASEMAFFHHVGWP